MIGCHHVRISGATGVKADLINGVYKPTSTMCSNVTVYEKAMGGNVYLQYNASGSSWLVKEIEDRNGDFCWASCTVPAKCLPQECPVGKWYVLDGRMHVHQSSVTISQFSKEQADAYLLEEEREATREVRGNHGCERWPYQRCIQAYE